jgi:hypothetical protein
MRYFEKDVLAIRFVGEKLKEQGLPIYELGMAFVGIQRIVNKAFLAMEVRLDKGSSPNRKDREMLALQIKTHEKSSDYFSFAPLIADPRYFEIFKQTIDYLLSGVVSYVIGDVLDRVRGKHDEQKSIFIGSIHADVVNIVNRIDNIGGCESIEIGSPAFAPKNKIKFTEESRDYVRQVGYEHYLGKTQTIKGAVFKLYPNIQMAEIRRAGGKKCKVFLDEQLFDKVRYGQFRSPVIEVTGRPRYRLGKEGGAFNEFEGHAVKLIEESAY